MRISYHREMKHNYLIVDAEETAQNRYESRIMEEYPIEGLLRLTMQQPDGACRFYYEITSKQPLGRFLENRILSGAEIRKLLTGIAGTLNRMERYLLAERSILLEPEYIYIDPETFRVWLCLVPGIERDFPESYAKLLEYFLGKVDHQDKESVVLAYGLYQETRKENYGIDDILKLIYKEKTVSVESGYQQEVIREEQPINRNLIETNRELKSAGKAETESIWARFYNRVSGRKNMIQPKEVTPPSWQELFAEPGDRESNTGKADKEWFHTADESAPGLQEPGERRRQESAKDTELLYNCSTAEPVRSLYSLDGEGGVIPISYYPFIIGKQEQMVDYCLQRDTVSRLHLRIDRQGENYQIMDLNSTNGTTVRGKLLNNNETVPLCQGDEVQIARYRYRFE